MGKPFILCVDDEKVVLDGLKSLLQREFGENYNIEVAESGEEALQIIKEEEMDGNHCPVVIADQLMPGIKGNELLKIIHKQNPKTYTILLTGQADVSAIADAVNHANLYRFIAKPWNSTDLTLTVREALIGYSRGDKLEEQNKLLKKYNEDLEKMVAERTSELNEEKIKSEKLLLNILPEATVKELKFSGYSEPRSFESVSILFADIKGFTQIASNLQARDLVKELEICFSAFDHAVKRNNLEKIKTIGDAYMCAGGLPSTNESHPRDIVNAAFEIINWLENWNKEKLANGLNRWELRIGIHTGPVVAGVIGSTKFAYDVWGDTVNIASRIETAGIPGRINISADTYDLVRNDFVCTHRGMITTKNRGEIDMYFVDEKR